jgi:hypothetical protein
VIDGAAVRDRLPALTPAAAALADQLVAGMSDREYVVVAVALVRALARSEAPP